MLESVIPTSWYGSRNGGSLEMAMEHGGIPGCSSQAEPDLRFGQSSWPPSDQQFLVAVDGSTNNIRKVMISACIRARPTWRPFISDLRAFIARAESRVPFRTKVISPCRVWFNRILRSKSCIWAFSDSFVDMPASLRSFEAYARFAFRSY